MSIETQTSEPVEIEPSRRHYVAVKIDGLVLDNEASAYFNGTPTHEQLADHLLAVMRATAALYGADFARVLDDKIGYAEV